jgi:chaperonin GroEL
MTDIEGNEKAFRIDDAIKACKSAIEKGYVAGGGVALPQIAHKNSGKIVEEYEKLSSRDMKDGYQSFFKSLTAPLSCILSNAGIEEDVNKIVEGEFGYGINVVSRERVNMIEEGIIDPAKAMMCVVENGASVACLFLTTSCAMVANEAK